jgi:hypothetical protein
VWPKFFYHKSAGRSGKMPKFQGTKYFISLSGRAVGADKGISTPENSILGSQSPASRDLNLDITIFSFLFLSIFLFNPMVCFQLNQLNTYESYRISK